MKNVAMGLFAIGVLFTGCEWSSSVPTTQAGGDKKPAGSQVLSSSALFRLGSTDSQASPEERPGWTRFAHDYWLDTTEVTQAEFQNLTDRNPAPLAARSPAKPVVNATWFDAILFCNARSKRDRIDTVYEYASVSIDSTGSVWAVSGLTSHLDRDGWRLPTEAEWEYAARAGASSAYPWGESADSAKASEYAWFQKNAGASLQEVARLKPNAWGFYDMSGNAMEWVQDWKGAFPKDTVTDFVGPDAPSDVPEVPLKGGAYNYGLERLRSSSRSATYAAYRSAKAEYVGFRCARGGFTATYTNASGQSIQAPPVSILRADVARMLGAQSARLVFLNRENGKGVLSWIDYGEASPVVRSLPDKDPVFHPVISPDGNWVAWCTVLEGSTGTSRIKARRLVKNDTMVLDLGAGAIPRWWVGGTDTFLIRASTAMDNTGSGWSSGLTTAQRWVGGALTGTVETWSSAGGYHDGRSGQYLYTGYRRLKRYDASAKSDRTLFAYPQNGKIAGDTSQVCNASAAPDGSGRVMFLDFGYSGKSTVVGRPYGIHEVAFVADSIGNVLQTFPVAAGKSQWDHLEWSSHPRWAVGMALEANGAYKEIDMLDLSKGKTIPLASGSELWMPNLWVSSTASIVSSLDEDSAGQYEKGWSGNGMMAAKLRLFWLISDSVESVFIGSSKIKNGIVPSEFSMRTMNFGYGFGMTWEAEQFLRNLVLPHAPKLKVVGLSLMTGWMFWPQKDAIWDPGVSTSYGYQYDRNHRFWADSLPAEFKRMNELLRSTLPGDLSVDGLGGGIYPANGWTSATSYDGTFPDSIYRMDSRYYQQNRACLLRTLKMLDSVGVTTVLVNFPTSPHYKGTQRAGFYEPPWDIYRQVVADARDMASGFPKTHFYDAHDDGNHDYSDVDAADAFHLSTIGGKKISHRLDSLLQMWMK